MPKVEICSLSDLRALESQVHLSAEEVLTKLRPLILAGNGLAFLRKLKFTDAGRNPLDSSSDYNFVEQLNQTFSHLVALKATEYILKEHPTSAPFILRLGPIRGFDIESSDGFVVAETFAAVTYDSNSKLSKDTEKVSNSNAKHKYVFYYAARGNRPGNTIKGVKRIHLNV